jgi:ribokinase
MTKIITLGSINIDLKKSVTVDRVTQLSQTYPWFPSRGETVTIGKTQPQLDENIEEQYYGGKGANQAVAAAMGESRTQLLGMVGRDENSYDLLKHLQSKGVDTDAIQQVTAPTGVAYIYVEPDGSNRIIVVPGANNQVGRQYIDDCYRTITTADYLLLQNEIPIEPVHFLLKRLANERTPPTVILDPAPPQGTEKLLDHDVISYITPNEHEYASLSEHLDAFSGTIIHKHGGGPVTIEGEQTGVLSPPAVETVETTGAGDILNGFLCSQLAEGRDFHEALRIAVCAASLSTTDVGAQQSIPQMERVRSLRNDHFD